MLVKLSVTLAWQPCKYGSDDDEGMKVFLAFICILLAFSLSCSDKEANYGSKIHLLLHCLLVASHKLKGGSLALG